MATAAVTRVPSASAATLVTMNAASGAPLRRKMIDAAASSPRPSIVKVNVWPGAAADGATARTTGSSATATDALRASVVRFGASTATLSAEPTPRSAMSGAVVVTLTGGEETERISGGSTMTVAEARRLASSRCVAVIVMTVGTGTVAGAV